MEKQKIKSKFLNIWFSIYDACLAVYNACSLHRIRRLYPITIMTSEETIEYIKKNNCSIARFGDGELELMLKTSSEDYQKISDDLSEALKGVFRNTSSKLLLCMPYPMKCTKELLKHGREFWDTWALRLQKPVVTEIQKLTGEKYMFGDSFVSRPFTGYKCKSKADCLFPRLKTLWEDKDVLFVEGEGTRLGVGNDLFDNARSIKRILAPAENAFDAYSKILEAVNTVWNGELVIMALGPTATVLASELSNKGIQALDIGHIDIQYEWYLTGEPYKPVKNKYVNESAIGKKFGECNDQQYLSQIVARVRP